MNLLVVDSSITYKKMFMQATVELDANALVSHVATVDEAVDRMKRKDYAIIVIDAEIPGLERLLFEIANRIPNAFVLMTARPSMANDVICADALTKGATDSFTKPIHSSYNENIDRIRHKMAGIIRALRGDEKKKHKQGKPDKATSTLDVRESNFRPGVVLIAASTGGPTALERILSKMNKNFPAPVLIVQHTLLSFAETLAQGLDQKSALRVKVAENRESVKAGTIYIAPAGMHMKLNAENKIRLVVSPTVNGVRPAADVLFESVADNYTGPGVLAVILTGMGRDGEQGLAKLKEKQKCFCIAQSEKTCVIYGMPRAAVEGGFADKVLDLDQIPFELESFNFNRVES